MEAAAIDRLRARMQGSVIDRDDAGYDTARRVWNGMIDRRPALIARCAGVADVQAALAFARDEGLSVAVRGGGHSVAGLSTCDGGLVIDLSPMNRIEVDPTARTARAGGGATWGRFDAATQAHGLATTGGAISTTGIGGLTLGGGVGYLMRRYGLACDNLIAAEVVTADGRVLTASAEQHPHLFWALRGGGGNFGVVTQLTYRLHPVPEVTAGMLIHPAKRAREVLNVYREATGTAPNDLTMFAGLLSSPDGDPVSALVMCHAGERAQAEADLGSIRAFGPPVAGEVGPMPYTAVQTMLDEGFPPGLQVYWTAHYLTELSDAVIETAIDAFARITSPLSAILFEHLGGAVAEVGVNDSAFAYREAGYNLAIIARWTDPSEADRHVSWARDLREAMRPYSHGVYVNYLGVGDGSERVVAAYGREKYDRLAAIKAQFDPDNVFRATQNIQPARR